MEEIRAKRWYLPELELIMVDETDEVIGYVNFARFHLGGKYEDELLLLSPVAVKTELQRQHISRELIEHGFLKARELGMWDVSEGLDQAFADVESYLGKCRFSDCKHEREPGCAIRAAIEAGQLDISRWESYQKLSEEAVDKAEMLRRKSEWSKGVAKFTRQRNKEIW